MAEGGQATYTVMLATWPLSSLTVAISGTSGTDLTLDKTSLTFSSSNWLFPQTVTVTAGEDDDGWDDTATLVHTATPDFAEGAEYDSVTADLAATVADNDTPGLVLSPPSLTVAEGGQAIYTVALATEPSAPVTVAISGTSGTDLTLDQTSLTFTASTWSTAQTVTVTAGEDSDAEPDDPVTLTHTVSGGDYGAVAADEVVVTIGDDDTASTEIELTLDPQQVTEGGGAQTVRVTAMLNAATRIADTVVRVTIAGNTATEGEDFGAVSSFNVTIPATAASATGTFSLTPVNDGIAEGEETLTVSAASPLPVTPATLTLADDDIASTGIALTLNPQQVTEDGGAQTVRVTATLNADTHTADTVVNVSVAGLTATEVEDFGAVPSFNVTIPATAASATGTFSFTPVNDGIAEGEETLTVSGASPLPVTPATLTLADDDTASTSIALTLNPQQVTEDGGAQTVRVTAMLNADTHTADTVVQVTVAGNTATEVEDFGAVPSFNVTIPATAAGATGTFSLTPVNDAVAEGEETLTVSGASPLPVTPATLTLADDDIVSTGIALSLDPQQVSEDGGAQTVRVTAMLNAGAHTADTVVNVSVAGLTATVVEDFGAVPSFNVTIPATAASATGTFSLTPVNDGIAEGEETLQVRGTSPLPVTPATLTLADDDIVSTGIALTLDPQQVSEDGGAQTVRVTAMLNADTHTADTVVNVSVAGLTATVVEDYAAVGDFQITIPATQTNGQNSFSLTPVNDGIAEGEETLTVSGASPLPVTPATLTLADDDIASTGIALSLDPQQVTEDGGAQTVRVTAMLNADTHTADTVVQVTVAGNTATEVEDFGAVPSFNVTIPATATGATGTFSFTPVNDGIAEGEETLQVRGAATGLTVDPATLILGDDDTASTGIALTLNPQQVTEDGGAQTVRVTAMLNADTHTADTVVQVTVTGNTATEVEDFGAVPSFNVTIPATAASATGTFSFTPVNDGIAEGEETLTVSGASPLPVTPATLTLADDDTASTGIALSLDPQQVTEDGGAQTVRVTAMLNADTHTADTVVNVSVAGLTATEVEDFGAVPSFNVTIPATAAGATGTFSFTPVNDGIAEGEETLQVRGAATGLTVDPATLILGDDDTASTGIALTLNPQQVTEDGGAQTVRVTAMLNADTHTADTVVQVTVAGNTATEVEDFGAVPSFNVTIPATATGATGTFSFTPVNDGIAEGEETLQVRGAATGLTVDPATLILGDDDTASTGIALTLNPQQVTEDGGAQTVRVTAMLNADTHTADTVVQVTVTGNTATEVEDFGAVPSFNVTIPATAAGATGTFSFTPVNDGIAEGEETLTVSGASPLPVTPATLTLADDDIASTGIALSLDPQQVTEDGGAQTVRVTAMLNADTHTADTVVNVSVAGLTATEVEDFGAVPSFHVTIPATAAGATGTFSFTPVNDGIAEGEETLQVRGAATGLTVDPATLILGDDDTASTGIALTLNPQQVTEDGGAQTVRVTAMLNADTHTADTVVQVTVAGNTATVVEDYAVVGGFQITIPATQTNGQNSFSLTPVNDGIAEGEETLTVSGASPLPVTPATLTLADDDIASTGIALSLDPQQVTEDGGAQTVRVTAMLNADTHTADTVVQVTVAGNTATEVEDFGAVPSFNVTIPATAAGATGTFTLTPVNDGIAEGEETLQVRGTSPLPVTPATLTLADDDIVSTGIALTLDPQQVSEDGGAQTVRVTAMLNAGAHTADTVVNVSVAGLTATVVEDYAAVGDFQITIPATQTNGQNSFSLTPVNDAVAEGDETLTVNGASPLPVTPATLTLADDDIASTGIALSLDPQQVTEDGGAQTVRVTAMLNADTHTADTVVQVTVAGNTATEVEDFGAVPSFNVTIPATAAGATGTFTLTPVNDGIAEDEETLQVRGTSPLPVTPATLTLADDDIVSTGIALTLDPQQVSEDGGAQTVRVTAMLNAGAHTADTVVNVSVAGLTATVVEDYATVGDFQITIPATQTNGQNSFSLTPVNDAVAEGDETLTVNGASPLPVTPATLTLADDDIASTGIALSLDPQQVTEDGGAQTVRVTAMLNADTHTADTVVQVTVAGNTATEVEDFRAVPSFNVTIPATAAGATGTFSLTLVNDGIAEDEETLQVRGTSPLPVTPATLTLADDDIVSTGIALTLDPQQVSEDGGAQTVRVTAMLNAGAHTADTVVNVSVAGLTATVVEDYATVGDFQITIPATQTNGQNSFSLTPVNDAVAEGDETLTVNGASPLPVTPATLTLADDDIVSTGIALTLNPEQITEQGGRQTVRVTAMLNADTHTADTVVQVTVAGNTATVVEDFAAVSSFHVTIPATAAGATGTFTLTPVNDGIAEGEETLQVRGASPLPVTAATLILGDDDIASTGIALSLDPQRVTEQGGQQTVRVTAMLNAGAHTADTVVQVSVAGLTATVVDDFAAVSSFNVTIPATAAGATGTFTLTPVNDIVAEGEETLQVSGTATGLTVDGATLTISDDDIASSSIALSLDPQRVTEQGGRQTVTVTAMLNAGARTADTLVNVTVAGLTATVVEDFAAVGGFQITIPATQTNGQNSFSLTPVNDGIAEGDETLTVNAASPLPVTPATLTLADDDIASTGIALTLNPQQVTEQGGRQTVRVTAMLNAGARTADTVVNVSVAAGTAEAEDFVAVQPFQITIPAGAGSGEADFSVTPVNDTIAEGDETLQVSGASPLPVTPATLTLADDDIASSSIALSLDPDEVTEQGGRQTVTITAMLNAGTRTADTVVNVSVAGLTATEVEDFAAVSSFNVTIPANQASATGTFSLTPVNDIVAEGEETLQVSGTATGLTVDGATLTISDDDIASSSIALSLDPQRVTEQGGRQTVTVTAMLNAGARTADTLVNVTVAGLTATVVEDFAAVGGFQITIPATQTNGQNSFSLTPVNDGIAEGDETLTVNAASPLPVTPATLTLADDDIASTGIALTLNPQQVTEQGGRQTVRVTAMLNAGARTADTVVNVSVAAGTAEAEDFVAVQPFQITIPAGAGSGEADFSVTPVNDTIAEGDETLQVSGASPLPVTPATLTLADDDIASSSIALSLDPDEVTEQGGRQTVTITAMLNAGTRTADTVVNVSVAGLTATEVEDFAAVSSFHVTIPANQPSGEADFSLTPVNDGIAEGEETLQVSGTATA